VSRHNGIVLFPWSALQRSRLWPDSSVAARQTFEQRQLWPSQIKKHVDRAERSNEPSTTARRQTTPDRQTPSRSHQQKSLTGFLLICPTSAIQGRFLKVGKSVRAAPILDLRLGRLWEERRASAGGLSCRLIFQTSLIGAPPS